MLIGAIALAIACSADAGTKDVQYVEAPSWVVPAPAPTEGPTADGAPIRVVYSDNQIRLGPDGFEDFQSYRLKILRPEGLAAGNVAVSWSPDAGDVKVHYVRIIRDKQVIDVLKATEFQVIQREGSLEKAMLNGELTAALQSPGLQVGDDFEFAATVRRKDPTLGDHLFGLAQLPTNGLPGAFRIRMVWPEARNLHWQASADVTGVSATTANGRAELVYEVRDPHSAVVADGAPARVSVRRLIEITDFDSWADVSRRIWPLFEKASVLASDSPIRKEIARISATSTDSTKRVEAALQLVEDRIRYVYIGLNGGNFLPATADETWARRFGDCKAKTALLLAILRELGIRSEAMLVDSRGGDGINERLPTPAVFDHVVVRVKLENATYWLDGSRLGDKSLTLIPPPPFRWVLPLRPDGGDLEAVPLSPSKLPDSIVAMDIDSSAGFAEKATIKMQQVLRGDSALATRVQLMAVSSEDADRAVRAFWRMGNAWIDPEAVSWKYDEQRGTLLLSLTGKGKLDWKGNDGVGRSLDIFGAGFTPPAEYHRPKEQDQAAPWLIEYPAYRCWATAIHLPTWNAKLKWDYSSEPMNTGMGGVRYWRISDLRDDIVRTVMSKRSEVPEITAEQADEVNKSIPTFNNNISRVYQIELTEKSSRHDREAAPPFQGDTDWTSPDAPCGQAAK